MNSDLIILAIVCLYMVLLLGVGYVSGRMTRSREDFFLAGRSLGSWITAISSTASSESGWVVLGFVGMAFTEGVAALWTAPGCLLGYWMNLYLLAPRLRRETEKQNSLTLPDFLARKFDDNRGVIRIISVLIIFLSLGGYVAAQMTAVGKAMAAILPVSYAQGVIFGGLVILLYTLMGGFRAVAYTDFIQGLIMVFALVAMPVIVLTKIGGYSSLLQHLSAIDPKLVTVTGGREGFAFFGFAAGLLGIGLGYPGQPHVITRYMAASSEEKIRQSQIIAMIWGVLVFYGAGFLGLAGRVLAPNVQDSEQLFPLLSKSLLHPIIAGVMLAAILSAIMSTVSSQLLVAASALGRDLLDEALGLVKSDKASLLAGRISVVALGLAAIAVAVGDVRVVFWFVLFAWSGLGSAFGPLILLSLWTGLVTRWGAVASMVVGFGVTIYWKLSGLSDSLVYELVPAFFLAGTAAIVVSILERKFMRHDGGDHENS